MRSNNNDIPDKKEMKAKKRKEKAEKKAMEKGRPDLMMM